MIAIRKGSTDKVTIGPALSVSDAITPVTTLALNTAKSATATLNNNSTKVNISSYTFAHIGNGDYHLTLQSGISNTVGPMRVTITDNDLCLPIKQDFFVYDEVIYDALFSDTPTNLPANVLAISDDATAAVNLEADYDGTGYNKANSTIGTLTNLPTIPANWITNAGIQVGAIGALQIADDAITAAKFANGAITSAVLATGAITSTVLADNSITATKIATGAITNLKFAAGAIDAAAIGADAITAAKIADNAIDAGAFATGAITAGAFAAGAIDAAALATDAVTEIAQGTWSEVLGSTSLSASAIMQIVGAAAAGKVSGAETTSVTIRNLQDTANIIVATVDQTGNRDAVVITTPGD